MRKGYAKSFFLGVLIKMTWNEIMEIGTNYPYMVTSHMKQIYFSRKIIEHDRPSKFFSEKDNKSFILIQYTKEGEEYLLNLAEKNLAIKSKFRNFPHMEGEH